MVQGRLEEAKQETKKAIDILERSLGKDHEEVGRILTVQAGILKDQAPFISSSILQTAITLSQGEYNEAKRDIGLAITIKLERLGPTHATVATSLRVLASILTDLVRTRCAGGLSIWTKFLLLLSGGIRGSKIRSGKGVSYLRPVIRQPVGHGL